MRTKIIKNLIISIVAGMLIFLVYSCDNSPKSYNDYQNRDSLLIKQYHDKVREQRGSDEFYISSKDFIIVRKNFLDIEVTEFNEVKKNDNVFFFDTSGNVQYQAYISDITDELIYVICEDLENRRKYRTELDVEKIKDLQNDYLYDIRIFRPK